MSPPSSIGKDGRVALADHVRCRSFDEDLVVVDLERGEYVALDLMGARMWELLAAGRSPAEVGASLATEYDASEEDILRDCTRLADELVGRGLFVPRLP